jgi:uncharacterized protein HemX
MLMRISLIVAILAALGAGVFGYIEVTQQIPQLVQQRDSEHSAKVTAQADASKTHAELTRTQGTLKQTQQDLAQSQTAQKKAEADRDAQIKIAAGLQDKLTKTSADLATAQADLAAYKATGKSPQEVLQLVATIRQDQDTIAAINEEKKVLNRKLLSVQNQLNELIGLTNYVVRLPADLKGNVVAVDPKWQFVVLNIGDEQGVLQDGQLLISRDAKLVAKVIVRTVYKDSCIANIMPDWKIGEVFEGDKATPAYPAS